MLTLRKMQQEDVAAVAAIEAQVSIEPWSEKLFSDCIRVGYNCWVFANDTEIAGFGLLSYAANEAHILNLVIASQWRKQGLARKMMLHLLSISKSLGAEIAYLEVRQSNTIAINLYKQLMFIEIGFRKGYYPAEDGGREDAITLAVNLIQ